MTNDFAKVLQSFREHPLLPGGHLQTIAGRYLPGAAALSRAHQIEIALPDGDRIMLLENRAGRKTTLQKILFCAHGLGGDAAAAYMVRTAGLFHGRGWHAFRMNHRGCGCGAGLARHLYHSGRSDDISAALQAVAAKYPDVPIVAVGFSLSGNALLKLLGEGCHPVPRTLIGTVAVTPPVMLANCADALSRRTNRPYDRRFVRLLRQSIWQRQQIFPDFPTFKFPKYMTVKQFDALCTAPMNGFASADDYYQQCSARQFLYRITKPTLILAAANDPFVPLATFSGLNDNPAVDLHITSGGGHMGFIARDRTPLLSHRWMDYAILSAAEFFLRKNQTTHSS
jgi:predicted alpha/beta-fold hydrolase